MHDNARQPDPRKGPHSIRAGVWLAVLGVAFLGILALTFPRHTTTENPTEVVNAPAERSATDGRVEGKRGVRQTVRRASAPEFVYQGKTLDEWVSDLEGTDQPTRQAAFEAFRAMGSDASAAIPRLGEHLNSSPIPNAAAWALVHIGTNSLPVLIEALTNGSRVTRMEVAGAIGLLREAAQGAVPALVECLRYEDAGVRGNAIASLQAIPKRPELAVPALMACLTDTNVGVRGNAATVIRNFGRDAEPAIPALVRVARQDDDSYVRTRAAESLRAISPQQADAEGL